MVSIFERCARWLLETNREPGWTICHGIMLGEWEDDVWSHCWLEKRDSDLLLDLSNVDKPALINVNAHPDLYATDEYTPDQLAKLISKHSSYGPFDNDLREIGERTIH